MRWPFPIIWIVPLCAAIATAYYVYEHAQDRGPIISIAFADVEGIHEDDTNVQYRGVEIGKVIAMKLSDDHAHAIVKVRLHKSAAAIATKGAMFWIVRPEVSTATIQGLGTLVTGPYIQANPGTGEAQSDFTGLDHPPFNIDKDGLRIVLQASNLEHLQPGSPIYYRGFEVGGIDHAELGRDATHVNVQAIVWRRYARLVRTNSRFWSVSGANVKGGMLTGVEVKVNSLSSLISGGVAFASPDQEMGERANDGSTFTLNDEPHKEWLSWSPPILVDPELPGEPHENKPDVKPAIPSLPNDNTVQKQPSQ